MHGQASPTNDSENCWLDVQRRIIEFIPVAADHWQCALKRPNDEERKTSMTVNSPNT